MKILNKGKKFELKFDGHDIVVPEGLSLEFPDKVGYHIQNIAARWGKDIRLITTPEEDSKVKQELEVNEPQKKEVKIKDLQKKK